MEKILLTLFKPPQVGRRNSRLGRRHTRSSSPGTRELPVDDCSRTHRHPPHYGQQTTPQWEKELALLNTTMVKLWTMQLSAYMQAHQLKPKDVAKMLGVTVAAISRYLNGTRKPKPDVVVKIDAATGGIVTWADFYNDHPEA